MRKEIFSNICSPVVKLGPIASIHSEIPLRPEVALEVRGWTSTWLESLRLPHAPGDRDGDFDPKKRVK